MDDAFATNIHRRMQDESTRTGPPPGFPALPDIPIGRYTDSEFYQAEVDRVFRGSWLFAGHTSDWAEAGAYRTLQFTVAPVLVVRGPDGILRAFLNACRHRGAPVVREPVGTAPNLVCQFHSWSYDLTGCLRGIPDQRDFIDLDPTERGLVEVRCESWGGMVFVSLNPDAPDLLDWLGPLDTVYGDLARTPSLRRVATTSYEQSCNWKTFVDAFLETYHVNTVHRDSLREHLDTRGTVIDLYPNGHAGMHIPYRRGAGNGVWLTDLPTMPVHELYRTTVASFGIFPNLVMGTEADTGFFFIQWWPLGVRRTRMDVTWFGVDWGDGDRPAEWEVKLFGSEVLMQEDLVNIEPMQFSLDSAAHRGIPLNYQERRIWQFHAEIDKVIGPSRIPDALRVPPLPDRLLCEEPRATDRRAPSLVRTD